VTRDYVGADVKFIPGDSNTEINEIIQKLPKHSRNKKVLSFCFADPFSLKNLRFSTIEHLSQRFMDFLILIPTHMDAGRNVARHYIQPQNKTVDEFVGTSDWRETWKNAERQGMTFDRFLITFYEGRMKKLDYLGGAAEETQLIRSAEKNLPLRKPTAWI
jgi:three-Cys-motif partner protein